MRLLARSAGSEVYLSFSFFEAVIFLLFVRDVFCTSFFSFNFLYALSFVRCGVEDCQIFLFLDS